MRKSGKLSFLMLLTLLAVACGGQATTTTAPATTGTTSGTTATTTATTSDTTAVTEPNELTILEWAFYEVPEMWVEFGEAHPDTDVVFNFGASDADIYAKILAGSGEDIMHFYTPYLQFYVDEGLIQPIDTSRLSNWSKVPTGFAESCTIDGVVYCVPWDWGFTSVLYRTDMIPSVDSWSALFDEANAQHVSMWDDGPGAVAIGAYVLGADEASITDDQLEEIKQMWIDQKDVNLFYWVDEAELEAAFTAGDVWAAYAWNGAYYRLLTAGVPVAYADPTEGRNSWVGQYAISADTDSYNLALEFLDGKLGEQTATHLLVDYAYGHVVPEYFSVVEDANLVTALSLDDPGILDRTNFTVPISQDQHSRYVEMWAEVKAAG